MTRTWKDVWAARTLDAGRGSRLEQLMAADGLDTGFGSVSEASWRVFVDQMSDRLGVKDAGSSVFEVGCGAGAFLYPMFERGSRVGGIDQSAALIGFASEAMPGGDWHVGDAATVDAGRRADVVAACGVFMYFPDHDYAWGVLERMVRKATRAVALLDVPDLATRDEAIAFRRGTLGEREYLEKYRGLDHLYFDRSEVEQRLRALGAAQVSVTDQRIDGYQNARYRFNAIARLGPTAA